MNLLETTWASYVAAEQDRIRDVSMARLREFVAVLMQLPEEDRYCLYQIVTSRVIHALISIAISSNQPPRATKSPGVV